MHLKAKTRLGSVPPVRSLLRWLAGVIASAALVVAAQAQTVETILGTGLFEPYGLAVGPGNLYYVTDSANNRVIVLNPASGGVTNLAGLAGNDGAGAVDGTGSSARFFSPQGIVYTTRGVIVADSGNNLIRRIGADQQVVTLIGNSAVAQTSHDAQLPMDNHGTTDGFGVLAKVHTPSGLAYDGGNIVYIADAVNGLIRKLDLSTTNLSTVRVRETAGSAVLVPARFDFPSAVAVSASGVIFVADSGTHTIYAITEGESIARVAGSGSAFASGLRNDNSGERALFKAPRGLFVDDLRNEILVSDSGNGVIRRISGLTNVLRSVETFAETDLAGLLNPIGIARDREGTVVFADLDANAIRSIRSLQSQPQIGPPTIGTVLITNFSCGTSLTPVTNATFFNEVTLAIQAELNTVTYFTFGPTENADSIPDPSPENGSAPPDYRDCEDTLPENLLSRITPRPERLTVRVITTGANRRPSPIITANFVFQAANPSIIGSDATSLSLNTLTEGADVYYSFGAGDPPAPGPGLPQSFLYDGRSLNIYNPGADVTIKVRAFKRNYQASAVIQRTFKQADARPSVLGVNRDFKAGIGSTIVVPVELVITGSNIVRSLQFRAEISPVGIALASATPKPRAVAISSQDFIAVPFPGSDTGSVISYTSGSANGLAIAYLRTNANFVITNTAVVAMLALEVPTNAVDGHQYSISILNPSGTSDGIDTPVALVAGTNRLVTIANLPYTVGDVARPTWYNAGDFGDSSLNNNDVLLAFRASLGLAVPYSFTDVYDAMDAFPLDAEGSVGGDGQIRFLDYQTILRRSLGLDRAKWARSWAVGGARVAMNLTPGGGPLLPTETLAASAVSKSQVVWRKQAILGALPVERAIQGTVVQVPIYLWERAGQGISGLQFNVHVTPSGDNPPIADLIFIPAFGVPNPSQYGAQNLGSSFFCSWDVGALNPPRSGSNRLGVVQFMIPGSARTGQSYIVHFDHADGSPDLLTQYDFETVRAAVWVNAPAAEPHSGISDEWKLHFFGSLTADGAQPSADADGDGVTAAVEFIDGTHPLQNNLRLQASHDFDSANTVTLRWFGASGASYLIEATDRLQNPAWRAVSTAMPGLGGILEFNHRRTDNTPQFFRVRITP